MTNRTSGIGARLAALGGLALLAGTVAGCGGGGTSATSTPGHSAGGSSASGGSSGTSGAPYATAQLAEHLAPTNTFTAPGGAISGISALKGKTITYIPIFLQSPYFGAEAAEIKNAAQRVGMSVQVCDGKGTPTVAATCFDQAIAGKSAGIITDALPYSFALNAYANAAKAGVPVVAGNSNDPVPAELSGHAVTLGLRQDAIGRLNADSVIADSGAAAHVLVVAANDSATTKQNSDATLAEFKQHCPGCTVSTAIYRSTEVQKIPTAVSAALAQDPAIKYVICQFDEPAAPAVLAGIKLRNAGDLKLVTGGASPSGLQRLKDGLQLSDTGSDAARTAWNETDLLLRLMTKTQVPDTSAYDAPLRVFNATNIAGVDIAKDTFGAAYSDGAFRSQYEKLWSAAS